MTRICHNCGKDARVSPKTHPKAVVLCRRCNAQHAEKPEVESLQSQGQWDNAVKSWEDNRTT